VVVDSGVQLTADQIEIVAQQSITLLRCCPLRERVVPLCPHYQHPVRRY
jgi:hypothetical protein